MTVNPGFAGQKFVPLMNKKIKKLSDLIHEEGYNSKIQVDGNIGYQTIPDVLQNGANMLVGGTSCLFRSDIALEDAVVKMREFIEEHQLEKNV
jgi:ribulose-phosphate 3-epimerase